MRKSFRADRGVKPQLQRETFVALYDGAQLCTTNTLHDAEYVFAIDSIPCDGFSINLNAYGRKANDLLRLHVGSAWNGPHEYGSLLGLGLHEFKIVISIDFNRDITTNARDELLYP